MSVILSPDEVQAAAGGYKRPGEQLRELHRLGFFRAFRARGGKGPVVVERGHYEAVRSGTFARQRPIDISAIAPSTRRGKAHPIDWSARTALYRHFDRAGMVIYIGIAVDPAKRESAHRCYSQWRDKIHRIEVEWFDTRYAAVAAERAAIAAESPKWNALRYTSKRKHAESC